MLQLQQLQKFDKMHVSYENNYNRKNGFWGRLFSKN